MASEVSICNAALALVGEPTIDSLTDTNNEAAIACNEAYSRLRDAELRKNRWGFAIKRAQLAAQTPTPLFGKANYFPVPSDFLRLIALDPADQRHNDDRTIENSGDTVVIATQESAPLYIRYMARITDPNVFDATFQDALAGRIAQVIAIKITQSETMYNRADRYYKDAVADAKMINAIEKPPVRAVEDPWITVRA
jgi:hypothetical protein